MNRFKRVLRLCVFITLIFLASVGVGLSGGVPIPKATVRKGPENENIELVEKQVENSDTTQKEIKG